MFSLDTNTKNCEPMSLNISCTQAGLSFWGMTRSVSSRDLYLEVLTTRIKTSLMMFLNKDVTIKIENVSIQGTIISYTIEGDYYLIGINIDKSHRSAWKGLLVEKSRVPISAEIRHIAS